MKLSDDWRDYAACRGTDIEIWFPDAGNDYYLARQICMSCTVLAECRAFVDRAERGLTRDGLHGMFAGETPRERRERRIREGRGRTSHTDAWLVLDVYRTGGVEGLMERFGVSRSTAYKRAMRARRALSAVAEGRAS